MQLRAAHNIASSHPYAWVWEDGAEAGPTTHWYSHLAWGIFVGRDVFIFGVAELELEWVRARLATRVP